MPKFYNRRILQTAHRRPFNPRTGLLSLALLASAACIAPPFTVTTLAQTPAAEQPSPDGAAFTLAFDGTLKLNADATGEYLETRRVKVQGLAALRQVAQQSYTYVEGMQSLDVVEAFTEKADGTQVPVDLATVVARDGVTGVNAEYVLDLKVVTVIFPDVTVGDTLVMTVRTTIRSNVFSGHHMQAFPLTRNVSRASSTVQVIAPSSLPLKVGVRGEGVQHTITAEGTETRHFIAYRGAPAVSAEDRMTSPFDRDPGVLVSTFADYEELARSYWDRARDTVEVTPEVVRLADEITRGVDDKRAQAQAISAWVKTNIRWVNVMFGVGRFVPHSAAAVLKNRYGDCKDHAVLMSALLAAKGIAAEHVLINSGDRYALPETAVNPFNHIIVYLPEFGVYDDPTAQFASFGVLGSQEYDKPVVRVSDGGAQVARTPAMKPEDHVSIRRTRLSVAADGVVSGESEQVGTGWFAATGRSISATLQAAGLERSAEDQLRLANTPGKGRFEIGSLTNLSDSYTARARFTYDARMAIKPSANVALPVGLGLQVRPGSFMFGALLPARRLPFTCFAGTQVEEIDVTFADGLLLPQKIDERKIETKSFVYTAGYRLEDRTLKVRHEFVSKVPGQVCGAEVGAEIAQPLRDVFASNATRMAFAASKEVKPAAPPAASETREIKRTAVVDRPLHVDFLYAVNPDCSSIGVAAVRVVEEPGHGKLTIDKGTGFTSFPQENPRQVCNRRRSDGTVMHYQPEAGYLGPDSLTVEVVYSNGASGKRHYAIRVDPKPAPAELTRAAAAGQEIRIGFLVSLDPDCASHPVASARIVEGPEHGEATVAEDTGFANFAKDNPRSACNTQRSDGTAIFYRGQEGYTGKDTLTVEIVYADGHETRTRYAIDVK
jgi:hypothetical protein